jgi:hypothetical protein
LNLTLGYPNDFCAQITEDPYGALLDALSDPIMSETFNPDVLGYGVRLSSRSSQISICIPTQMAPRIQISSSIYVLVIDPASYILS